MISPCSASEIGDVAKPPAGLDRGDWGGFSSRVFDVSGLLLRRPDETVRMNDWSATREDLRRLKECHDSGEDASEGEGKGEEEFAGEGASKGKDEGENVVVVVIFDMVSDMVISNVRFGNTEKMEKIKVGYGDL